VNANKQVGSWGLDLFSARWGLAMGTYEQRNKLSGFIEGGEFLHVLREGLLIALS